MKRLLWLFAACTLSLASVAAQASVAVLDCASSSTADETLLVAISDRIADTLIASRNWNVLDRARSSRAADAGAQASEAELARLGARLGVDYVLAASLQQVGSAMYLRARLVLVRTGALAQIASAEGGSGADEVLAMAAEVARQFADGLVSAQVAADTGASRIDAEDADAQRVLENARARAQTSPSEPAPLPPFQSRPPSSAASGADPSRIGYRLYGAFPISTASQIMFTPVDTYDSVSSDSLDFMMYTLRSKGEVFAAVSDVVYKMDFSNGFGEQLSTDFGSALTLKLGKNLLAWGAVKAGLTMFFDISYDASFEMSFDYAFDLGMDMRLGSFLFGLCYTWRYMTPIESLFEYYQTPVLDESLWFMFGLRF